MFTQNLTSTPGTGKYKVDASATGYTTKSVAAVDITTANQSNVNFTLVRKWAGPLFARGWARGPCGESTVHLLFLGNKN